MQTLATRRNAHFFLAFVFYLIWVHHFGYTALHGFAYDPPPLLSPLGPPVVPFSPPFLGEGSTTKLDRIKKHLWGEGFPYQNRLQRKKHEKKTNHTKKTRKPSSNLSTEKPCPLSPYFPEAAGHGGALQVPGHHGAPHRGAAAEEEGHQRVPDSRRRPVGLGFVIMFFERDAVFRVLGCFPC